MAATAPVEIPLVALIDGALKNFDKFSKDASKSLNKVEGSVSSLNDIVNTIGAGFVANKIVSGIKGIINSAAEGEAGLVKMRNALKVAGDFSETAAQRFEDLAAEIQATTKVEDDAVISAVALAKTFGQTNEETEKLVRAAIDLAEATGTDLDSAIRKLGQSYSGMAGTLTKLLPTVKDLTEEQLRAGGAVDLVANRFRGSAAGATETFSGALTQLENNFSNLLKSFGEMIIGNEVLVAGIQNLSKLIVAINSNSQLKGLIAGVAAAAVTFATLATSLIGIVSALGALKAAFAALGIALSAVLGPIGLIVGGLTAAAAALAYFLASSDDTKSSVELLGEEIEKTKDKIRDLQIVRIGPNSWPGQYAAQMREAREEMLKLRSLQDESEWKQVLQAQESAQDAINKKKADNARQEEERQKKLIEEMLKGFDRVAERIKFIGRTKEDALKSQYQEELKFIDEAFRQGRIADKERADLRMRLGLDFQQKMAEEERKRGEEDRKRVEDYRNRLSETLSSLQSAISNAASNPFAALIGPAANPNNAIEDIKNRYTNDLSQIIADERSGNLTVEQSRQAQADLQARQSRELAQFQQQQIGTAAGLGALQNVLGGKQGAIKLVGGAASAIGTALLGPAGQALGPIVEALAQGPEAVRGMVNQFIDAMPDIIQAVIESIPVVIEVLADRAPEIIDRLVERSPEIIERLAQRAPTIAFKLATLMPRVALALSTSIAQVLGDVLARIGKEIFKSFNSDILKGATDFVAKIIEGAGQFVAELVKKIGESVGGLIPGGGGGGVIPDNIPIIGGWKSTSLDPLAFDSAALSMSAKADTQSSTQAQAMDSKVSAKLDTLISLLSAKDQSQEARVTLQIGEKQLADVLLNLDRRGFRTRTA